MGTNLGMVKIAEMMEQELKVQSLKPNDKLYLFRHNATGKKAFDMYDGTYIGNGLKSTTETPSIFVKIKRTEKLYSKVKIDGLWKCWAEDKTYYITNNKESADKMLIAMMSAYKEELIAKLSEYNELLLKSQIKDIEDKIFELTNNKD